MTRPLQTSQVEPGLTGADHAKAGLILSGGGARAAYQVGVLTGIAEIVPKGTPNPFSVICGTSAGAINAAGLAANAHNYRIAVRGLERVWSNLTAEQVYRTDARAIMGSAIKWFFSGVSGGQAAIPTSLFDVTPLKRLLSLVINFDRIEYALKEGLVDALCISASSYSSGESVSFYQTHKPVTPWNRARRLGMPARIQLEHLMASSAIPVLFPAVSLDNQFFGDGAVRQLAPISPALHLGANKVLVIGVSGNTSARYQRRLSGYPSVAQVIGHMLNSAFVDTLEGDVERLERINHTLSAIPLATRQEKNIGLKEVELLKIFPSQPIDEIATQHITELPRLLRFFLRGTGATHAQGAAAISYLLFEPGFCRSLMKLGYADAMARKQEIRQFLGVSG